MPSMLPIDPDLDAVLADLAGREGLSKQDVVRAAVLDLQARRQAASDWQAGAEQQRETWQRVLDGLHSI